MYSINNSRPSYAFYWLRQVLLSGLCLGFFGALRAQNNYATPYQVTTLAGALTAGSSDGTGSAARFNIPAGVALDFAGNLYVADSENHLVRYVTTDGVVTTVKAGLNPAHFDHPGALAFALGNVFVADYGINSILKIAPGSGPVPFAGAPSFQGGDQDGLGMAARFNGPLGLAADTQGNLYVGDYLNHTIRKITVDGTVSTFAGSAGHSGSADGAGSTARFSYPRGVAVDRAGNVYVADTGNHAIRKIAPDGVVTTLAGLAGTSGSADGSGSVARFNNPMGVAVDAAGGIYVADTVNNLIRKIAPDGTVSTLAGSTVGSADGSGAAAHFNSPTAVAVNEAGTLFITDADNNIIRQAMPTNPVIVSQPKSLHAATTYAVTFSVVASGSPTPAYQWKKDGVDIVGAHESSFSIPAVVENDAGAYSVVVTNSLGAATSALAALWVEPALKISTLAGTSSASGSADGLGGSARFDVPYGIAVAGTGDIYVTEIIKNTIRKISPDGLVTTIAGLADNAGSTDGVGVQARFFGPYGVAVDGSGTLYVADTGNNTVRKIAAGGVVSTLAGTPEVWGSADGTGGAASFKAPWGAAVDSAGNVFIADQINSTIRKVSPGGVVTTFAGLAGTQGSNDGQGSAARFNRPVAVAVDSSDNVWVSDQDNDLIRKITPAGLVTTITGMAGGGGWVDGALADARFSHAEGLAVNSAGEVFIAELGGTIRKITTDGFVVTLAGRPDDARGSSDGVGRAANFFDPSCVAVSSSGVVYITDAGNHTIRKGIVNTVSAESLSTKSLGDFDGNGKADLVWTNTETGDRSLWFLNGNAMSGGASLGVVPVAWTVSATADFDGDGKSDIFWTNTSTGDRAIWGMNGSTMLTNTFMGTVPPDWVISGAGDFNADGKADLVWTNTTTGDRAMWLMNGSTVLGGGYLGTIPVAWMIAGVGDFNGDGKADLVWSNTITGERAMWFMNGSTQTAGATLGTIPVDWVITGVGDFNGDGKADIFLSNTTTGDRVIWLMNGSTIVTNAFMGTVPVEWTISGTGDFNGDGKKDLFWTNTSTGDRAMWLLNGATVAGGGFMGTVPVVWHIH